MFNENEDKITHNSNIRCLFNENEDKESPLKSIIEDIKRDLYYFEKMKNLSTLDIKNIKEKLIKFKKDVNECKAKYENMNIRIKNKIFIRLKKWKMK